MTAKAGIQVPISASILMASSHSLFPAAAALLLLAACSETREDLGLGRNMPDEFAVVERPPLAMPPDYGLRPPRPGAPRPQLVDTSDQASQTLFNGNAPAPSEGLSDSEKALLSSAGAAKTDPAIRETVDRESAQKTVASPHLVERLTDWSDDGTKPATMVDAAAESARIKNAQAAGQPVTQGATPVIEKQQSGWLGM